MPDKILAKMFEDLYWLEKQARDLYNDYLHDLKDGPARVIVTEIRDDEERHMRIAQQLLDLLG